MYNSYSVTIIQLQHYSIPHVRGKGEEKIPP
jgi:hypothetical protein